jgi:DNA (cytosine-5)-methyltransferase 1
VADVDPRYVFAENTERRAIDRAADDLEAMGYQVRCVELSAADMGADHVRSRYWLRAHADDDSELLRAIDAEASELSRVRESLWQTDPNESRVADGDPYRMDRLAATGNAQVPIVAAAAWRMLGGS